MASSMTLPIPLRSGPDSSPLQFSHTFEETCSKSLVILCQKKVIDHEFLILHGVRNSHFLQTQAFSGITTLPALNRNAKGVNDVPCRYKGVSGVLLVS